MKSITILMLCLMVCSPALTAGECTASANPILNELEIKVPGVKIGADAQDDSTGSGICNSLWKDAAVQTCCVRAKLENAFKEQVKVQAESTTKFVQGLAKTKSSMDKIRALFANSADITTKLGLLLMQGGEASKLIPFDLSSMAGLAVLGELKSFADNFDEKLEEFKINGKTCFEALKVYRGQVT